MILNTWFFFLIEIFPVALPCQLGRKITGTGMTSNLVKGIVAMTDSMLREVGIMVSSSAPLIPLSLFPPPPLLARLSLG